MTVTLVPCVGCVITYEAMCRYPQVHGEQRTCPVCFETFTMVLER